MASSDMIHAGVQTMEPLDRTPRQSVDRPGRAGILQPIPASGRDGSARDVLPGGKGNITVDARIVRI
jgi:hypothetical protein